MCHALVSHCGVLHARANATMLPWAVGYNVEQLAQYAPGRVAAVARCIGLSPEEKTAMIRTRLADLQGIAGMPRRLRELGVQETQIDALVEYALHDRALDANPVAVDAHVLRALFDQAL
jgi:alcohol dehydrogenase class IV